MIEITDLRKSFDDKTVLRGITSTFEDGKTSLIIGRSGSGKSTLLQILGGLDRLGQDGADEVHRGPARAHLGRRGL